MNMLVCYGCDSSRRHVENWCSIFNGQIARVARRLTSEFATSFESLETF